jgi:hypothetical protein
LDDKNTILLIFFIVPFIIPIFIPFLIIIIIRRCLGRRVFGVPVITGRFVWGVFVVVSVNIPVGYNDIVGKFVYVCGVIVGTVGDVGDIIGAVVVVEFGAVVVVELGVPVVVELEEIVLGDNVVVVVPDDGVVAGEDVTLDVVVVGGVGVVGTITGDVVKPVVDVGTIGVNVVGNVPGSLTVGIDVVLVVLSVGTVTATGDTLLVPVPGVGVVTMGVPVATGPEVGTVTVAAGVPVATGPAVGTPLTGAVVVLVLPVFVVSTGALVIGSTTAGVRVGDVVVATAGAVVTGELLGENVVCCACTTSFTLTQFSIIRNTTVY